MRALQATRGPAGQCHVLRPKQGGLQAKRADEWARLAHERCKDCFARSRLQTSFSLRLGSGGRAGAEKSPRDATGSSAGLDRSAACNQGCDEPFNDRISTSGQADSRLLARADYHLVQARRFRGSGTICSCRCKCRRGGPGHATSHPNRSSISGGNNCGRLRVSCRPPGLDR